MNAPVHVTSRRARLDGRAPLSADFGLPGVDGTEGKPVPEWLHIFPLPGEDGKAHSRDGRVFRFPDGIEAVVDASNEAFARLGPGPVDLDHELYSWFGGGDASGWAHELELRDDGIWARWEPLERASEKIRSKKYGYTSSVVSVSIIWLRDEDGWIRDWEFEAHKIEGFGLTNNPAMEVKTYLSSGDTQEQEKLMKTETIKVVLSNLGLDESATPEQIESAFKAKLAESADPSLADFVPRVEHDAVKAKLAKVEAGIAASAEEAASAEREALLSKALVEGKVQPSSREYFAAQLAKDGGIEEFKGYLASQAPNPAAKPAPKSPEGTEVASDDRPPPGVDAFAYELAGKTNDLEAITHELRARKDK